MRKDKFISRMGYITILKISPPIAELQGVLHFFVIVAMMI